MRSPASILSHDSNGSVRRRYPSTAGDFRYGGSPVIEELRRIGRSHSLFSEWEIGLHHGFAKTVRPTDAAAREAGEEHVSLRD